MITITSRDNQYLKLARSLHSKKGRSISESFLVEGLRLCGEAVQSSLQLRLALISWLLSLKSAVFRFISCPQPFLPPSQLRSIARV